MAKGSPPARGAWIEIVMRLSRSDPAYSSPPARGAWIEIMKPVTLLICVYRRPPHGGRGLKWVFHEALCNYAFVAPRTGGVD